MYVMYNMYNTVHTSSWTTFISFSFKSLSASPSFLLFNFSVFLAVFQLFFLSFSYQHVHRLTCSSPLLPSTLFFLSLPSSMSLVLSSLSVKWPLFFLSLLHPQSPPPLIPPHPRPVSPSSFALPRVLSCFPPEHPCPSLPFLLAHPRPVSPFSALSRRVSCFPPSLPFHSHPSSSSSPSVPPLFLPALPRIPSPLLLTPAPTDYTPSPPALLLLLNHPLQPPQLLMPCLCSCCLT
jgi:hypothetical protein